jgi:hypothetical protein
MEVVRAARRRDHPHFMGMMVWPQKFMPGSKQRNIVGQSEDRSVATATRSDSLAISKKTSKHIQMHRLMALSL